MPCLSRGDNKPAAGARDAANRSAVLYVSDVDGMGGNVARVGAHSQQEAAEGLAAEAGPRVKLFRQYVFHL